MNMRYLNPWFRYVSVVVLLTFAVACQSSTETKENNLIVVGTNKLTNSDLAAAVVKYYEAENKKDWRATHNARTPEYRKLVPFDSYKKAMDKGMADWKLKKIEILEATQSQDGAITVKIRFHEEFGPQAAQIHFEGRVTRGMNTRIETTVWKHSDDGWFCANAGERGRIPEPLAN